jgi:hypothetical protein
VAYSLVQGPGPNAIGEAWTISCDCCLQIFLSLATSVMSTNNSSGGMQENYGLARSLDRASSPSSFPNRHQLGWCPWVIQNHYNALLGVLHVQVTRVLTGPQKHPEPLINPATHGTLIPALSLRIIIQEYPTLPSTPRQDTTMNNEENAKPANVDPRWCVSEC